MSKTGISTAKGFHKIREEVTFASQLKNNNWTTLCENKSISLENDKISVNLDKGATYLFYVALKEENSVSYGHTSIMTIPESGVENTDSTAFAYKYYFQGSKETVLALRYSTTSNNIMFWVCDNQLSTNGLSDVVTTIKYMKIISGV